MGFYGNITNTSRTQFQFDFVYPNRMTMDSSASEDGIFTGRYVLVNYEENSNYDYYFQAYKSIISEGNTEKFAFFSSPEAEPETRLKWVETPAEVDGADAVYAGQVITIPADHRHNLINLDSMTMEFWVVEGEPDEVTIENDDDTVTTVYYANFIQYEDPYSHNYHVDKTVYGTARGYDSTVWQKTYINGEDKYVMVAELNTIVPTFDIEADAPKMVPLTPHFDADSTNIYYKLHWSPPWGFRVKAASPELKGPILNDDGSDAGNILTLMSSDTNEYLSDDTTTWYKTVYDGSNYPTDYVFTVDSKGTTGRWIPKNEADRTVEYMGMKEAVVETPAAIYYNKAGFSPETIAYAYTEVELDQNSYEHGKYYKRENNRYVVVDDLNFNPDLTYYEKLPDSIKIQPTGRSGHMYNKHQGTITDSVQEDMQELSIMLPTIGNTIAAIWDLVYGGQEINHGFTRNLDVSWERARASMDRHGIRLVTDFDFDNKYLYQVKNVDTLAGAINSVHDLMGMIITSDTQSHLQANINSLDENRIYYDETNHTFNRKRKMYRYLTDDPIDYEYEPVSIEESQWAPGEYFILGQGDYIVDTSTSYSSNQAYFLRKLSRTAEYTAEDSSKYHIFDGRVYAYKDFVGTDPTAIAPINADYVRDKKYYKDKTYYQWSNIDTIPYPGLSESYVQNKFYYYDGNLEQPNIGNYVLSLSETPTESRTYFQLIEENLRTLADLTAISEDYALGLYVPGKFLYKQYLDNQGQPLEDISEVDENTPYNFQLAVQPTLQSSLLYEQKSLERNEYYMLDTRSAQEAVGGQGIYAKTISYVVVSLTDTTYIKGTYYVLKDPSIPNNPPSNDSNLYDEANEDFDENTVYYAKNEALVRINENQYVVNTQQKYFLLQFSEGQFYYKNGRNYKLLTRVADAMTLKSDEIYVLRNRPNSNNNYKLSIDDWDDPDVSAFVRQTEFYEPGVYHYLTEEYEPISVAQLAYQPNVYYIKNNGKYVLDSSETWSGEKDYYRESEYTDYILDTYPTKTHGTRYYKLIAVGDPIVINDNFKFWDSYEYYIKNGANEYILATDEDTIPNEFYSRNVYYVINDDRNVIPYGMPWNNESEYVPAGITLARREEYWGLEPFGDFARNINTMHGMLLKTKAMLDYENKDTRDLRTVQGALNSLNDKLAFFSTWAPGQFIVADKYGRLQGAELIDSDWITTQIGYDETTGKPTIKLVNGADSLCIYNYNKETIVYTDPNATARAEVWQLYDTWYNNLEWYSDNNHVRVYPEEDYIASGHPGYSHIEDWFLDMYPWYEYYDEYNGGYRTAGTYNSSQPYCLQISDAETDFALYHLTPQQRVLYEQGRDYEPDYATIVEVPTTLTFADVAQCFTGENSELAGDLTYKYYDIDTEDQIARAAFWTRYDAWVSEMESSAENIDYRTNILYNYVNVPVVLGTNSASTEFIEAWNNGYPHYVYVYDHEVVSAESTYDSSQVYYAEHNWYINTYWDKYLNPTADERRYYTQGRNVETSVIEHKTTFKDVVEKVNQLYPVGSVYVTSSNEEEDQPANIFGGNWELIHKGFKYMEEQWILGTPDYSYQRQAATVEQVSFINQSDIIERLVSNEDLDSTYANTAIIWSSQMIDPTQDCNAYFIRERNSVKVRLTWYNPASNGPNDEYLYNDIAKGIAQLNLKYLGLNTYSGWSVRSPGMSDLMGAILIMFQNPQGLVYIEDTLPKSSNYNTIHSAGCSLTYELFIPQRLMADSACDEFVWKRIA